MFFNFSKDLESTENAIIDSQTTLDKTFSNNIQSIYLSIFVSHSLVCCVCIFL